MQKISDVLFMLTGVEALCLSVGHPQTFHQTAGPLHRKPTVDS